jgi:alanyl-tRNA synthetase
MIHSGRPFANWKFSTMAVTTIKRYLADASLVGDVVVETVIVGERPCVRLRDTPFHVQGGGQKADRGIIGPVAVLDVRQAADGGIDHFVESTAGLEAGAAYPFAIDPDWRRTNAVYHSAGHLLAGVCERLFPGVRAAAGHQFPGEARVDFEPAIAAPGVVHAMTQARAAIEAAVRAEVNRALPITIVGDPYSDRAAQVGDFAPIACGGTHAASTAEIAGFAIRSIKRKGSMVRIGYAVSAPDAHGAP